MLRKVFVHSGPLHTKVDGLTFSLYSAEEIKKLSVVKVFTSMAFNALGHPLPGGLYDPAMGPYDMGGFCSTCQQTFLYCPGHFGRIELPLPVINPLFIKTMLQICRLSCLGCHNVTVPGAIKHLTITQMRLLDDGLIKEAQDAEFVVADILLNQETSGKKAMGHRQADEGVAKIKFENYLAEIYNEKDFKSRSFSKASSKNLENLKQAVLKRALSYAKMRQKCQECGAICKKLMLFESRIVYSMGGFAGNFPEETVEDLLSNETRPSRFGRTGPQKYLTPMEAMTHLRKLWGREAEFLQSLFPVLTTTRAEHPTDLFFVEVVGVPPPKNRAAQMLNGQMMEHPQNLTLRHVVQTCSLINYANIAINKGADALNLEQMKTIKETKGETFRQKLETLWNILQADLDHLMDREKNKLSNSNASQMIGLKQVIEKKEGLFRMHMMGKRVNYAARTVITPDPNIDTEEVGIPDVFAKVLTFPTPVTPWNVHMLKKMVINGPEVHPGAVAVESETGQVSRLDPNNIQQRQALANRLLARDTVQSNSSSRGGVKTVYRHLMNGDYLLLNRQPSLHRPSIMAHRARVLYGDKVFRLHYANCKHYNADFDGDEMNAHFPQSHIARSEAANLVNVCSHFLVPKDGTPLAGLIQDHIVAAVRMTIRGRFFSYRDYVQLVYFALSNYTKAIETEPPTIIKPFPLWSGKQVISTLVKNLCPPGKALLTIKYGAKIKSDEWRRVPAYPAKAGGPIAGDDLSESCVIFRNGDLLSGILDKVSLGATPFGLVHAFYELYGNQSAGAVLSAFSRLMTNFLQWEGFTLGIKDVLVTTKADKLRRELMREAASKVGHVAAALGSSLSPDAESDQIREKLEQIHRSRDPKKRAFVDLCYKKQLDGYNNQINKVCLPHGLVDIFPNNNLQLLVQSGAKGSAVNTMQMSCALGQIELEGKRPPMTISGKTLPSFTEYDVSPRAGGFIAGRFLTGIKPPEFFFHCMAGREGLIDTAVKTSRSGYLQRCLCKLLEGVVVQYDGTVRDSDGSVIQYLYGEDGLDVGKSQYLKSKQLQFLEDNIASIMDKNTFKIIKELGDKKKVSSVKKKISKWVSKNGPATGKIRRGGFLKFCEEMSPSVEHLTGRNTETGRSHRSEHLLEMWRKLQPEEQIEYEGVSRCPDPVTSYLRPDSNFTAVSESLDNLLSNMKKANKLSREFENVVHYKAMQSLSCPGDAVGILAAQSIGEPSTQMTLNTFHFAGRGEMNVTLGIPRLREILMVASANIKTPSMDIPFLPEVKEKQAEKLRLQLTKVTMAQVLQRIEVRERINIETRSRVHILTFVFLKASEYSKNFCVKPKHILAFFERGFVRQKLCPALKRVSKRKKEEDIAVAREGDSVKEKLGNLDDDDDGEETKSKNVQKALQEREKKGTGEDHESSDEEQEMDDADATQATRRARHTELEYEAPEEEEILIDEDDANENDDDDDRASKPKDTEIEEDMSENEEENMDGHGGVSQIDYDSRVATVLAIDELIQGYDFDQDQEQWCSLEVHIRLGGEKVNMASVLREVAEKAVIHQTPSISRAFIVRNGDAMSLKTEGINILAMASYRHMLDIDRLHCNNIHTMAERYGIEAASRVIVKEMTDVFKVYGIVIDPRHLTLIADYMTFSGTYRPFNRIGIESSASPLQQMSFETVVTFLRDATLTGKHDNLTSPSARLVTGKPTAVGTGLFGMRNHFQPFRLKS